MADRISRSSNESVKLANRLAKTEQDTRLDLNDNIDSFRAICFVANGVDAFLGLWNDDTVKMEDFYAKDAVLDVNNDPLAVDGRGDYWQCYVYYIDEDPKSWDPRVEEKKSAAYWGKVKKLHKALIPKSSSAFGLLEGSKPDNESEWKIKFLKGGPKRGEWTSGLAIEASEGSYLEPPDAPGGSGGGGGGSGGSGGNAPGIQRPQFPPGIPPAPSSGMYHSKCVNGLLTWEPGQRPGLLDSDLHEERLLQLEDDLAQVSAGGLSEDRSYEEIRDLLPWFDLDTYRNSVRSRESATSGYNAENKDGYYGAYQMGYDAMINHGYLPIDGKQRTASRNKYGNYSQKTTQDMFLEADWTGDEVKSYYTEETLIAMRAAQANGDGAAMLEAWKADTTAQDNLFAKYTMSRLQTLVKECDGDLSDVSEVHGLLMAAHLIGFGKIDKWDPNFERFRTGLKEFIKDGTITKDANETPCDSYIQTGRAGYLEKHGNPCEDPNSSGEPEESIP